MMQQSKSIEAFALKKLRENKGLNRKQAGILLDITFKSVEKFENGRTILTPTKIEKYSRHMTFPYADYVQVRDGKGVTSIRRNDPQKVRIIETITYEEITKKSSPKKSKSSPS